MHLLSMFNTDFGLFLCFFWIWMFMGVGFKLFYKLDMYKNLGTECIFLVWYLEVLMLLWGRDEIVDAVGVFLLPDFSL